MKKLNIDRWMDVASSLQLSTVGEVMKIYDLTSEEVKMVEKSNSYEEYVEKWVEKKEREKSLRAETCDAGGTVQWITPTKIKDLKDQLDRLEANQREMLLILNTIK